MYKDIVLALLFHIDDTTIPIVISNNTLFCFKTFQVKITMLRNLVQLQQTALKNAHKIKLIAEYEKSKYANYAVNKAAFIISKIFRGMIINNHHFITNYHKLSH